MNKALACLFAVTALLGTALGPATAQEPSYPTRPVRIIVAFPVGGLLDTVSRIVGDKLTMVLGQQFVIESRPGAGGTLATAAVARAEPDGYTLMMINDNHAVNPSVFKNIPYDSVKDFAPIGFVGSAPMALSANARLPVRSVQDLVELTRQQPGKISYASVGIGSASHLSGELFAAKAGVRMLHVPFRGGAPAINDLVAGHVDTMFVTAVVGGQHMKTGALTPLALAASARFETLPEVPTMAEAGYPLEAAYWFGLAAPAGTPPTVLAKLEAALSEVLAMPDLRKRMTEMGAVVTPLGSRQFGDYIRAEMAKWADVIAQNNIRFE
ncbi:MAG TPA: tripartite tricarboxylate transporter substrate binding protein [Xanthobacteraceae bacterium]|nr:tripartite tricarboxylate transporter substrate binding protein [Xanthobacteraceae bacterium]